MKILKKIAIYGGIAFVVIVITIGILINVFVNKDLVAKLIEDNINGRVEIADISVPLWATFSGITIDGFKIGKKDGEMKKAMDERKPMKSATLSFEQFNFRLAVGKLIFSGGKELELKSMLFKKPKIHVVIGKNGGNNITPLLVKKKTKKEKEAEAEAEAEEPKPKKKKDKKDKDAKKAKPFSIKDVETAIKMSSIGLRDGLVTVNLQKSGQTIILSDLDFEIKDIDIDGKNLKEHNKVTINAGLTVALKESKKKGVKSFKVIFDSNTNVKPFNEKTGRVTEQAHVSMGILKGSKVTGLAIFKKIKSGTAALKKIGVDLSFLGDTMELSQDAKAGITYSGGKITFDQPPALVTKDFTITLEKGDYINTKSMKHKIHANLVLGSKHSAKINKQVEKKIDEGVGKLVAQAPASVRGKIKFNATDIRKKLLKDAQDKEGNFKITARSTKKVADPLVEIIKPKFKSPADMAGASIPNLGNLLGSGFNKLKSLGSKKAKEQIERAKKEGVERAKKELGNKIPKLPF